MTRTHSPTYTTSRTRLLVSCALALSMVSGCAFIEAATEQTIGSDYVPPVSQEITWPSVDELTGMTAEQIDELAEQGFPKSLAQGTFAHLQGALKLSGQCQLTQSLDDAFAADPANPMKGMAIDVVSCTDESCTDVPACEDFRGMSFTANVTLELFDAAQAEELQETLEIVPKEALVQLRFLVSQLNFFRNTCENDSHCGPGYECCGEGTMRASQCTLEGLCEPAACATDGDCGTDEQCCGLECAPVGAKQVVNADGTMTDTTCSNLTARGSIHSSLDDFSLRLGMGDGPKVLVIDKPYLDMIAASPQRFDVDIDSDFTKELKNKIFPCDPSDLPEGEVCPAFTPPQITVSLSMRIAQQDLYQVSFEGAGLELTIQPEIVVSALAVVEGVVADNL
ncbi:MAG: hypothetical protein ACPGU1_18355 [Myxococcota bacterium]